MIIILIGLLSEHNFCRRTLKGLRTNWTKVKKNFEKWGRQIYYLFRHVGEWGAEWPVSCLSAFTMQLLAPLEYMFFSWDFVASSSFTFTMLAELQAKSNPLLGQTFEYLACMHAFA